MAVMQKMNIATGESNEISLLDANGGVLRELIEREFELVMKNIMDVNTDTKAKRSITVKFTFAPSSDRSYMATSVGRSGWRVWPDNRWNRFQPWCHGDHHRDSRSDQL